MTPEETLRTVYQLKGDDLATKWDGYFDEDLRVRIPGDPAVLPWYAADLHSRDAFKQHIGKLLAVADVKSLEPATIFVGSSGSDGGDADRNGATSTGVVRACAVMNVHLVHKKTGKELRYSPCEVFTMVETDGRWRIKTLDVYVDTAAFERLQAEDAP